MERIGSGQPDWTSILRKVIELETQRGFDDRSVWGGIDSFRQRWHSEMASRIPAGADSGLLLDQTYAEMATDQRERWASLWLELLEREGTAETVNPGRTDTPSSLNLRHLTLFPRLQRPPHCLPRQRITLLPERGPLFVCRPQDRA